jgi:hypothetical protein
MPENKTLSRIDTMSYIIAPTPTVTLKLNNVEERIEQYFTTKNELTIAEGKKPRPALTNKLKAEMLDIVRYIIAPQLTEGFKLDVSNDTIATTLGVTARRARYLRQELNDAGVIYFPENTRPKAPGHVPIYLVVKEFIQYPETVKHAPAGPKTSKTYNQDWCDIWDNAKADLIAELKASGSRLTPIEFRMVIQSNVNFYIHTLGLEKVDFLK